MIDECSYQRYSRGRGVHRWVPPYSFSVRCFAALFPCEEGSPFILSQGNNSLLLKSPEWLYGVMVRTKYKTTPDEYVKPYIESCPCWVGDVMIETICH